MTLDEGIPAVSAANASGARAATEHLLSLGHRRIGAITGPRAYLASSERLNGYEGALAAAGVLPDPAIMLESTFDIEGGAKAAARLLDAADPPTAIFAFNDNTAIGRCASLASAASACRRSSRSSASTTRRCPRS